jgi:hypothetical protein
MNPFAEEIMLSGNPASQAKENAAAYVSLLMEFLGDNDPLAVLEEQGAWLASATSGIGETMLRRPEKPGKWSIIEVVQHLADSDLVFGYRLRMVLAHPTPEIQGYDQDLWAKELKYGDANLAEALEQHRVLRLANLRLLRSLAPAELERTGIHSERGPESVIKMMKMMAGHDILHRNQIKRIKRAHGIE